MTRMAPHTKGAISVVLEEMGVGGGEGRGGVGGGEEGRGGD